MGKIKAPFNLNKWISENRHLLKPPVGNKNLYVEAEDFIVMIVGGPNARKDYHYNETEELFYQIKGEIIVKTQQNHKMVEVEIKEGEMFLLPPKIPHSPIRPENSIGLVIERKRESQHKDGLMWFSETANELLYEEYFKLAKENNMTMSQLAQAFVNTRPFVTSNIIGATTMDQLKENIDSVNIELTDEIIDKINIIHNNNPNPSP